jgi:hypothetical protein
MNLLKIQWNHLAYRDTFVVMFELDLKFVAIWKIKFKYLKVGEMFLQVFDFFKKHFNIDVVNILIYIF